MRKIIIFNQEISIDEHNMPDRAELVLDLKIIFLKKCILDILSHFAQSKHLPNDLLGFVLHLETDIKQAQLKEHSDQALALWLRAQIKAAYLREQLHPIWSARVLVHHKLSFLLEKLHTRLFDKAGQLFYKNNEMNDAAACIEKSVQVAVLHLQQMLKQQLDVQKKNALIKTVQQAYQEYQQTCWWPISSERHEQYLQLLMQIEQAKTHQQAAAFIYAHTVSIERAHHAQSLWANLCCYQRKSRWAYHLQQALMIGSAHVNIDFKPKKNAVEQEIEQAIQDYLAQDVFYHNRTRRSLAYQLLAQLQQDALAFNPDQKLQRKYQMRSTLDDYIQKIDESFSRTYFFSKYYQTKRSRLALQLEAAKLSLIHNGHLPHLELKRDVKQPIITLLQTMLLDLSKFKQVDASMYADMRRDTMAVCNAILEAQTPHAIEIILESHVWNYAKQAQDAGLLTTLHHIMMKEDNIYFVMAIKLESAVSEWQIKGLLPAASGYQSFLSRVASERQNNENELQDLERHYGIKIPRNPKAMHAQVQHTQNQAQTLLKRIQNI